ncbi:MAG TPA: DHA2 family efflux MFS transporter permease subunit [Anaeromyxobacteraceae bacterium]|nr:DHA2 family efflux MFS transporter permease subunit [Anaeromyxobacteraceae bacterium]
MAGEEDHAGWRPRHSPWAIAFTVTLATFMEVLDTSIANVALPHIAGGLSASQDEATWVLTSYLVSNAVVLPLSAWISGRLGRKRFYMSCVVLFTASSFLCGFAPSLPALIVFRVLQGMGGGGLAPSEQAILADTFPPARRGMAFAMYGLAVVLAPAIGPTLGGYIVDHASWRWIFYINVPVGILSLLLSSSMVEDPPWLREEKERSRRAGADWLGLGLVAVAFGSLQVVLDKGQEDDWFSSPMIVGFAVTGVICLAGTVVWEAAHPDPIVNVRLFRNRNFATSVALMFTLGAVLYATTVLIPLVLQVLMGYSAERAGEVLSVGGLVTMAMMPVVGFLVSRVPAKYLIAPAFAGMSLALFHMSSLNLGIDAHTAAMYRVYQAIPLAFLFIPINTVCYIGIPREQNNQISGMMNLARNIGGSVGISFLTTMVARRSQSFQNVLVGHVTAANPYLQGRLAELQRALSAAGPAQAARRAYGAVHAMVLQQAGLLSYVSIVRDLAIVSALFVPLVLVLVKRNEPGSTPAGAH